MSLHNVSYQHWDGEHRGIWQRRWVIAANGLRACLDSRWAKNFVMMSWVFCLIQILVLFGLGQLLVEGSMIYTLVGQLDSHARILVNGLVSWLIGHPEISVRTTYNIFFYFAATYSRMLAMVAVALVIPHLITRDISSKAIIIYSSKAISRFDYFLGKFGTVFGLLFLVWLGPLLTTWVAGNFLSSNWHFFWHSRGALINTVTYVLLAMTALSLISLGISALSTKPRAAAFYWIVIWLVGNALRVVGEHTKPWVRHLSISYDLDQISQSIFNLGAELDLAEKNIPLLGNMLSELRNSPFGFFERPDITGSATALALMVVGAVIIMHKRVKPE